MLYMMVQFCRHNVPLVLTYISIYTEQKQTTVGMLLWCSYRYDCAQYICIVQTLIETQSAIGAHFIY